MSWKQQEESYCSLACLSRWSSSCCSSSCDTHSSWRQLKYLKTQNHSSIIFVRLWKLVLWMDWLIWGEVCYIPLTSTFVLLTAEMTLSWCCSLNCFFAVEVFENSLTHSRTSASARLVDGKRRGNSHRQHTTTKHKLKSGHFMQHCYGNLPSLGWESSVQSCPNGE